MSRRRGLGVLKIRTRRREVGESITEQKVEAASSRPEVGPQRVTEPEVQASHWPSEALCPKTTTSGTQGLLDGQTSMIAPIRRSVCYVHSCVKLAVEMEAWHSINSNR
jgi:hypothetical protein